MALHLNRAACIFFLLQINFEKRGSFLLFGK